ncbi:hypothetical protein PFISCL1PPCAC_7528, partial [Pristionchus fissidentatus]
PILRTARGKESGRRRARPLSITADSRMTGADAALSTARSTPSKRGARTTAQSLAITATKSRYSPSKVRRRAGTLSGTKTTWTRKPALCPSESSIAGTSYSNPSHADSEYGSLHRIDETHHTFPVIIVHC